LLFQQRLLQRKKSQGQDKYFSTFNHNMSKIFPPSLFTAIFIATALTFSCTSADDDGPPPPSYSSSSIQGSSSSSNGGSSSPSGGKGNDIANYKTKKIGEQTWMAENLNYAVEGSKCYNNEASNCTTYGRLYNWVTAMALPASCETTLCSSQISTKHRGICPVGWHIPSQAEWHALKTFIESDKSCFNCDAKHLKATSDWNNNGNGLDTYGFAALPGGYGSSDGYFDYVGYFGYWWCSSERVSGNAYLRSMIYDIEAVYWDYNDKSTLLSVRCLQD
jgi:uncharacterized protein (TIGR02145 family)